MTFSYAGIMSAWSKVVFSFLGDFCVSFYGIGCIGMVSRADSIQDVVVVSRCPGFFRFACYGLYSV